MTEGLYGHPARKIFRRGIERSGLEADSDTRVQRQNRWTDDGGKVVIAQLRSSLQRISGVARVWCLAGAIALLSAVVVLTAGRSIAPPLGNVDVAWWMLAGGFALGELLVLDVRGTRDGYFLSMFEVPLVIGLVYSTPVTILLGLALGVGAELAVHRPSEPDRWALDVTLRMAAALVAVFVFVPIIQVAGSAWLVVWIAAFAATLAAHLVTGILTNAAIALSDGVRMRFRQILDMGTVFTIAKTGLALVIAMMLSQYPLGLVVVAIPSAIAFIGCRGYVKVRRQRDQAVWLQRATRLGQRSLHPDEMLPNLLAHLRDTFHADIAELVVPDETDKRYLVSRLGPDDSSTILAPVDLDPTQGVWARVTAEREGILLARPIRNPQLAEHYGSLGITDAIVSPIRCEQGRIGILTIANRTGDFSFGIEDLDQLEALAKQIDVTIRNVRQTQRLEAALTEEAETNKLKEDFLATVSHELRNPLTSIQGYVKTMRIAGDTMSVKEREEFFAAADRAGERLRTLIEDLLFTSGVETQDPGNRLGPVGLAGLVRRVVEDRLEHLEPRRIVLRFPGSVPPLWTNEEDVRRIVVNLLDNAIKYSPADMPVTVSANIDGAGVRISFHDLRPGIPASERERIFDRFYQLDHGLTRSNGGVGLGLHISRRIAESLGGRVWLDQTDDSGSVFCLWLPASDVASVDGHDGRRGRREHRLAHTGAGET
jgi:signal transduction histidine kinase